MVERGLAIFFFALSAAYLHQAADLSIGSLAAPKSGFVPWLVGLAAVLLTGINLVRTMVAASAGEVETNYGRAAAFTAAMAAYVVALPLLGFASTTVACTFLLLKISGAQGFVVPALLSGALAGGVSVGFGTLLNLPLP
jgi:hypothetical protein